VSDVLSPDIRPDLSEQQAEAVLHRVAQTYDAQSGVNWDTLKDVAEDLFPQADDAVDRGAVDRDEDAEVRSTAQVSFAWTAGDVQALRPDLGPRQAMTVLHEALHRLDAAVGMNNVTLREHADTLYPQRQRRTHSTHSTHRGA